jgi:hypothetical protein
VTTIVSAADTPLPLQVFPRDQFGNAVANAVGFAVTIGGLLPSDPSAVEEHTLEGPGYIHTVTVPQDLEATLTITFSLNTSPLGPPLEISVSPPPSDYTKLYER